MCYMIYISYQTIIRYFKVYKVSIYKFIKYFYRYKCPFNILNSVV